MDIRRQESYLRRLTALSAFSRMAEAMDADTVRIEVLPVVLEMATDGVSLLRHFIRSFAKVDVRLTFLH